MQIELSESEVKLLDQALQTWEADSRSSAMLTSLVAVMLCPKEERVNQQLEMKKEMEEADKEGRDRRLKSLLLRAKLYQALARESEHAIEATGH